MACESEDVYEGKQNSDATTTLSNELEIKEVYWGHPPPFSGIFTCNLGCRVGHYHFLMAFLNF